MIKTERDPCPFCGKPGFYGMFEHRHYVKCMNKHCPVMPKTRDYPMKIEAINAWNTRHETN